MDSEYKKKLEALSRGAVGEKAFEAIQRRKKGPPVDTSVSADDSERIRQAQLSLLDPRRVEPSEQLPVDAMRPQGLLPQTETDMFNELMTDEPTPVEQVRYDRLKQLMKK